MQELYTIFNAAGDIIRQNPIASTVIALSTPIILPIAKRRITDGIHKWLDNRTLTRSGLSELFSNVAINNDKVTANDAVIEAFRHNQNLHFAFVEFADRAIIKKKGQEPIELNFRNIDHNARDGQIWTVLKERIGQTNPKTDNPYTEEELYEFARNCSYGDPDKENELSDPLEGLEEIDKERITEHAVMRCSWMRKLYDQDTAREASTRTIAGVLKSIVAQQGDTPKTNKSEAGILGFRWNKKLEDGKEQTHFSVFIKPRTNSERDMIVEKLDSKRIDADKNGRHLNGEEGLQHYATVKRALREKDNAEIQRKRRIENIIADGLEYRLRY